MDKISHAPKFSIIFKESPKNSREWHALISLVNTALNTGISQETLQDLIELSNQLRNELQELPLLFKDKIAIAKRLVLIDCLVYSSNPTYEYPTGLIYDPYFIREEVDSVIAGGDLSSPRFFGLFELVKIHAEFADQGSAFREYLDELTNDLSTILHSNKDALAESLKKELERGATVTRVSRNDEEHGTLAPKRASRRRADIYDLDDLHIKGISILDVDVKSVIASQRKKDLVGATKVFIEIMLDFYQDQVAMYTESTPEYLYHGSKTEERMEYVNTEINDAVELLDLWIEEACKATVKNRNAQHRFVSEALVYLHNALIDISNQYGLESEETPFSGVLHNLALKNALLQPEEA